MLKSLQQGDDRLSRMNSNLLLSANCNKDKENSYLHNCGKPSFAEYLAVVEAEVDIVFKGCYARVHVTFNIPPVNKSKNK